MDIIGNCLYLTPEPCLSLAFAILRVVVSTTQNVKAAKQQLTGLATSTAQLLTTLNGEFTSGRLSPNNSTQALSDLDRLLHQISDFVIKQEAQSFLKSLYTKNDQIAQIQVYQQQIGALVMSFQISALLDIRGWQARCDNARAKDQEELMSRLDDLEANQSKLLNTLNPQPNNSMAIMASLQRQLQQQSLNERERQFYFSSLRRVSALSGSHTELESWTITSYDVEFGAMIGSGGFGEVYKGTWNQTPIAIKVLKADDGVTPSSTTICREIDTWSKILHPHILQFLGANVLDDRPFIVMPYLKNGNARDYIQKNPQCDRLLILHHISLGINHLHTLNIVHGDLKAMNVLIDDSGKAVLCDFGLSRVKADATSKSATPKSFGAGSRNWMAPERLTGGSLRKPSDIYAFGMTIFEIYTNDIPLGHIDPGEFAQLVAREDVRPERPDEDEAPQLTDAVWQLAENCWAKSPMARPIAKALCNMISTLLRIITPPVSGNTNVSPSSPSSSRNLSSLREAALPPLPPSSCSLPSLPSPVLPLPPSARNLPPLPSPVPPSPWISTPPPEAPTPTPSASERSPFHRLVGRKSSIHSAVFSKLPSLPSTSTWSLPFSAETMLPSQWAPNLPSPAVNPAKLSLCLVGHSGSIHAAVFSPDGSTIASGSNDKTVRIWDARTGQPAGQPIHTDCVDSVSFSPDGQWIVTSGKNAIRVWSTGTGRLAAGPFIHPQVFRAIFSIDGRHILFAACQTVCCINALTGNLAFNPMEHGCYVSSIAASPDGKKIVSGCADCTIRIWDARNGGVLAEPFKGHTNKIRSVAFSPDGERVVSGSDDKTIRIWNGEGKLLAGPFNGHTAYVMCVAFSPDGRSIVSCGGGEIRIWDSATGGLLVSLEWNVKGVETVTFSPDGEQIMAACYKSICLGHWRDPLACY